ncbi:MAG: Ubiquitin carboxyl-terminal hydrolase 15 [Thelocarpon impressellum]|nr:MAG: Ubiquitin carboxyl-terminal hydrolase 15 [Thelocarpon impressellum]
MYSSSLVAVVALLQLASPAWAQSTDVCSLPGAPCQNSSDIKEACRQTTNQEGSADPQLQQKCICEKGYFDNLFGCVNCQFLSGDADNYETNYVLEQSSAYCSGTQTVFVDVFEAGYVATSTYPPDTVVRTNVLSTSTEVSNYYTSGVLKTSATGGGATSGTATTAATATTTGRSSASAASTPSPTNGAAGGLTTGYAPLSATTSSTKKRKLAPLHARPTATYPARPSATGTAPHGAQPPPSGLRSSPSYDIPPGRTAPSPPRALPPHLQNGSFDGSRRSSSPAPDCSSTAASSPSAAYAGLSLDGERPGEMSTADGSRGTTADPEAGDASASPGLSTAANPSHSRVRPSLRGAVGEALPERSSSPAMKRPASDLDDLVAGAAGEHADATAAAGPDPPGSSGGDDVPSIEEQIEKVKTLSIKSPQDGQKGYLVASSWLERVKSKVDGKYAASGETPEDDIGPVDNSSLVAEADFWPANLTDEAGEPFVPLKLGLVSGEDYEILPEEAWQLILRWYGSAPGSPTITRFAHNTNPDGAAGTENLQYESYPPLYTISKLRNDSGGLVTQSLKDATAAPLRLIASRSEPYNEFLKRVKPLLGLDRQSKVRVWRIMASGGGGDGDAGGMTTPAASRSASPAPSLTATAPTDAQQRLLLDLNAFLSLEDGSQREAVDVQDQTSNEKYNGHLTLGMAGLAQDAALVLEEQIGGPGGGEWVSEAAARSASGKGVHLTVTRNGITSVQNRAKAKANRSTASGRSSPAPAGGGATTRGRVRRDGRTIGTCGLSNLGNTCYMNSALQCVRSVEELTEYFRLGRYKHELNPSNPLSHNGDVAKSYANLLEMMYSPTASTSVTPRAFKNTIGRYGPSFSGYGQQDSQEFLGFLLDGLQEDLNRIHKKPYVEKPDSTDEMVNDPAALRELADKCWGIYKARNDSVVADLFAGTYKSTLVCPVCDKVSITFDPFNNLTLQLPIENAWSKQIYYFPLDGPPKRILVDMDKNGSIKALKEFVAARAKVDPLRLHAAEIYKSKIYKVYEDNAAVSESIQERDDVAVFELDDVPTNFPAPARKRLKQRSMFSFNYNNSDEDEEVPAWDSPLADRLLVPLFHRRPKDGSSRFASQVVFGFPSYVVISRDEASNFDAVLRKVLRRTATMTTRNILEDDATSEEEARASEDEDDMVVTTSEDADSSGGAKIKTDASEGEDGFVDISMKDPGDASQTEKPEAPGPSRTSSGEGKDGHLPKVLTPGNFIPPELRNLFQMKILSQHGELIPTGWNTSLEDNKEFTLLASRVPVAPAVGHSPREPSTKVHMPGDRSPASEEEVDSSPERVNNSFKETTTDSDESEEFPDVRDINARQAASARATARRDGVRPKHTYSRKGKQSPSPSEDEDVERGPLIRLGEAIIVDWTSEAHEALFTGTQGKRSMRGCSTWDHIDLIPDEQLDQKRALRSSRRKRGVSLGDCLDEFGKEEILSENDAWYCPRCKEFRRASKKFELWKCPDILIIHLKRFSASRGLRDKIDVLVDFPIDGLDLSDRVAMSEEGKSSTYDLFAVDNHYGGLGGGHYTACARNFIDGNWYDYNDTMATKKSPQGAVTAAAYLLFYRRRSEKPLGGPDLERMMDEARHESESQTSSRASSTSPAGEGQRLDDSSRTGSSSALHGVGATLRAGGGLAGGSRTTRGGSEGSGGEPPAYTSGTLAGEPYPERMQLDEGVDADYADGLSGPAMVHPLGASPTWGFDYGVGMTQMRALSPRGVVSDDENLMDGASDKAADGSSGASRGSSARMRDFDDEDFDDEHGEVGVTTTATGGGESGMVMPGSFGAEEVGAGAKTAVAASAAAAAAAAAADEEDVDDAPVAEVHVEEGEGLVAKAPG